MGPPTGGMMEGLLVSNSPFLGDFLDDPDPDPDPTYLTKWHAYIFTIHVHVFKLFLITISRTLNE